MASNDADFQLPLEIKRTPEEIAEIEENRKIEEEVKHWLKEVVIGMNLCPFAERPMRENNLRTFVVRGDDDEHLLSSILVVLILQEDKPGTSLGRLHCLHSKFLRQYSIFARPAIVHSCTQTLLFFFVVFLSSDLP